MCQQLNQQPSRPDVLDTIWEEKVSKSKNRVYYKNKYTGETQWTKPVLEAPSSSSSRSVDLCVRCNLYRLEAPSFACLFMKRRRKFESMNNPAAYKHQLHPTPFFRPSQARQVPPTNKRHLRPCRLRTNSLSKARQMKPTNKGLFRPCRLSILSEARQI